MRRFTNIKYILGLYSRCSAASELSRWKWRLSRLHIPYASTTRAITFYSNLGDPSFLFPDLMFFPAHPSQKPAVFRVRLSLKEKSGHPSNIIPIRCGKNEVPGGALLPLADWRRLSRKSGSPQLRLADRPTLCLDNVLCSPLPFNVYLVLNVFEGLASNKCVPLIE